MQFLETPIHKIEEIDDIITITSFGNQHKSFKGRYCICTIPPPLVPSVIFNPPLPGEKVYLLQRMPLGSVIKTIVRYPRPFWRENGFSGNTVSDEGPICASFDYSDMDKEFYAILGFIPGRHSVEYRNMSQQERRDAICEHYRELFNSDEALEPSEYFEMDWCNEVYSRGCYLSVIGPGILSKWGNCLRDNHGRVHFASTELATKWTGYMDGAIQSGRITAEKILELDN